MRYWNLIFGFVSMLIVPGGNSSAMFSSLSKQREIAYLLTSLFHLNNQGANVECGAL